MSCERKFYARGFENDDTEAVLTCFAGGLRIIEGSVGALYSDRLMNDVNRPFVLESKAGSLAAGGAYPNMPEFIAKYIVRSVVSCVKRNHANGLRSSVVPLFSDVDYCRTFLVVAPIPKGDNELQDSDEDYARLERYAKSWIDGTPRMFV
jgi:hypothetical protein